MATAKHTPSLSTCPSEMEDRQTSESVVAQAGIQGAGSIRLALGPAWNVLCIDTSVYCPPIRGFLNKKVLSGLGSNILEKALGTTVNHRFHSYHSSDGANYALLFLPK